MVSVVLLRFPERHLQKRYERISVTVMATWLLSSRAIHAVTWPCWATPKNVVEWPLWLANCDLSESAFLAVYSGEFIFYSWPYIAPSAANLADSRTRPTYLCARSHRIYCWRVDCCRPRGIESCILVQRCPPVWKSYPGLAVCIAIAVIPVMLFLANIGRRLLQLRIGGMVAEINSARTPDGIQSGAAASIR